MSLDSFKRSYPSLEIVKYITKYGTTTPITCKVCHSPMQKEKGIVIRKTASSPRFHTCLNTECLATTGGKFGITERIAQFCDAVKNHKEYVGCVYANGICTFKFDRSILSVIQQFKPLGARFVSASKSWQLPMEDEHRAVIAPALATIGFDVRQYQLDAEQVEQAKRDAEQAKRDAEQAKQAWLDTCSERGLYPFQLQGVRWLMSHSRGILGDDMGLGKTVQSLMAFPPVDQGRCLVITSSSTKLNWVHECQVWRPEYSVKVIMGSKTRKRNPLHEKSFRLPKCGEIIVANYEQVKGTFSDEELSQVSVIVDEAQALKNPKSARTKRIRSILWKAKTAWGLTGTPLLNRQPDLWALLQGFSLSKNAFPGGFWEYAEKMGGSQGYYGMDWAFGCVADDVPARLRKVMLRRTKEEQLPGLPSKLRRRIRIPMDARQRKVADAIWAKYTGDNVDLTTGKTGLNGDTSAIGQVDRLVALRRDLATKKIATAVEFLDEYWEENQKPIVVFSAHVEPCETLGQREGWASITGKTGAEERQRIVEQFQRGELRGVAGTIKSMGVGLTLLTNIDVADCDTMLFLDLEWNPSLNLQAEDRICRIHKQGKERARVLYVTLAFDHVVDEHVLQLVENKAKTIDMSVERASNPDEIDFTDEQSVDEDALAQALENVSTHVATGSDWDVQVTASELDAIVNAKNEKQRQERARTKLDGMREKRIGAFLGGGSRSKGHVVTPAEKVAIQGAIHALSQVCDGALSEDGMGFNRPDQSIYSVLSHANRWDDNDTWLVAWSILLKYKGQVGSQFPILWTRE